MNKRTLAIDIETYSEIDLTKCGVYAYSGSPSFEVLLIGYAFDDEPVKVVDLACGEQLPQEVLDALTDSSVAKTAFNASFERVCLSRYLNLSLPVEQWYCTATQALLLGLPLSLKGVGTVLGLEAQKLSEGEELIRYFSVPCKPTKSNGGRTRNLPGDAPDKWERYRLYNIRDVEVEREIRHKLHAFPIPQQEQAYYGMDQEINDRGVLVDPVLVEHAVECDRQYKQAATERAYALTGLENPNSVSQVKDWLSARGVSVTSLDKKAIRELIKETDGETLEMLKLRLLMSKTSVRKYEAIQRSVCADGRVHGLFKFYGANRTGRWASRLVQVQNLPQNHLPDLELARELVRAGRYEDVELFYDNTPGVLSELIRTAFVPKEGYRFIVADFSAIEARVLSWLAGEQWRMDVFASHGKIYEASASQMFHVPIEEITKGSPLRQKGKISELALGYGGGVGALKAMGALDMGVPEDELPGLVNSWRGANPRIVRFWWDLDAAALKVVRHRSQAQVGRIGLEYRSGFLFVTLPSGRKLAYVKPRIELNKFGREGLTYEGIGENKKWSRIETYGPKLTENVIQGTARDLLAYAMLHLTEAGYQIVMHIHDEAVAEVPVGTGSVEEMTNLMAQGPAWAAGLPLRADGYECNFYKKD